MEHSELIFFFFTIAFVYASVGFGGGSSYLAVLALYALPFKEMRLIALICNIIVVTGGTLVLIKNKQFEGRKILQLVLLSVPAAYLGAKMKLSEDVFFIILGVSLLIAAVLLWIKTKAADQQTEKPAHAVRDGAIGGAIGFLSGMVGIGGGIFLSPILNLMKWDTSKKIAATASMFILVNSVSGLIGQVSEMPVDMDMQRIVFLCGAVLLGGQLGSRMGAVKFNLLVVKRVTAVLVFVAGVEVLFKHLPWFK